jgi:UDP-N-acetylglucosamine acyltransferase
MSIHPTAIVHPDAQLADDVTVHPYAVIGEQVRIGSGTSIGPHAVIAGDTVIGERNTIASSAQVGILTQDLKHNFDLPGRCEIGNDNVIREFATITASTMPTPEDTHRVTSIGNNNFLMAYVHIGHDCHIRNNIIIGSFAGVSGHIEVFDYANISGLTALHHEVQVGSYAFVGGMSRVSQDCPPYMLTAGIPCKCYGPNTVGLERRGFDAAARKRVKELYRITYRSKLSLEAALDEIERSVEESVERTTFVDFIRNSTRGISR